MRKVYATHCVRRVTRLYSFLNPLDCLAKIRQSETAVNLLFVLAPFGIRGAEGFHVFIPEKAKPTAQTLYTFAVVRIWF
ncbi:MAG: hypothetical protein WCC26_17965 [Terracidiphilus sp.]